MATLLSLIRRIAARPSAPPAATATATAAPPRHAPRTPPVTCWRYGDAAFQEGDRIMLHGKRSVLTAPLHARGRTKLQHAGWVSHDEVLGKRARDAVRSSKDASFRLGLPTLEQYTTLTPRLVTPVYAADANLIVSLLDIHVSPPPATPSDGDHDVGEPLEILEAGTGHGSLTLHLARAVHAANSPPPALPPRQTVDPRLPEREGGCSDLSAEMLRWKASRGAVVHTVDVSPTYSARAETLVRGFRRGMYAGDVDFHVGPVEEWIAQQMRERRARLLQGQEQKQEQEQRTSTAPTASDTEPDLPFLAHAILDMPAAHERIPAVCRALRVDGLLAVFMPSVTQIGECVRLVREARLPLALEKAVELGTGISGGRLWDVRTAVVRGKRAPGAGGGTDEQARAGADGDRHVLVCRPKVGDRIVGGGFVGLWRKIKLDGDGQRDGVEDEA